MVGCARSAQSRSQLGDLRVPGRPRQPAAYFRRQCRQGGRRAGEKAGHGGFRFRLRRFRAGGRATTSMSAKPASAASMPLIQGGKLRMLGIASPERLPGDLAKYPTLREQGLDVVTANSYTVLVPNGLKPEQIAFWARRARQGASSIRISSSISISISGRSSRFAIPRPPSGCRTTTTRTARC